jgi:ribonuclease D
VDGDFKRLRESFPEASHYRDVQGVLELSGCIPHTGGLSGLCRHVLEKRLDKSMQTSDWQARPLSEQQQDYAALDAYVLLLIRDIHMQSTGSIPNT